jgi:hypothetical protein
VHHIGTEAKKGEASQSEIANSVLQVASLLHTEDLHSHMKKKAKFGNATTYN